MENHDHHLFVAKELKGPSYDLNGFYENNGTYYRKLVP